MGLMVRSSLRQEAPRRVPSLCARSDKNGKPVAKIATQLGITAKTLFDWRSQDEIDRGARSGMSTSQSAGLSALRQRIRELENELEITRKASELLKAQSDPKGGVRSSRRS